MVTSAIGSWLFLPATGIHLPGIPDYGKAMAATAGILLGTLVFEPNRLMAFRLRWFDLPIILWSLCPFASSISNGREIYDGLSAVFLQTTTWFLPYLIGRLYFTDAESLRELVLGMIVGAVCLIPLCFYEIKMSPCLQQKLYGFGNWEGERYGGYRPRVFFSSSLELGLWMNAVTLMAWWLWRAGQLKSLGGLGGVVIVPALVITAIACKTTAAILLISAGVAALWICWKTKTKWALWRTAFDRADLLHCPHHGRLVGQGCRPTGSNVHQRRASSLTRVPPGQRGPAYREGPAAAVLRLGRLGPKPGLRGERQAA